MIAILHYAFLKTRRDRSLYIFLLGPAGLIAIGLLASSIAERRFGYPFLLSAHMSATQNASILGHMVGGLAMVLGAICAFWTFRAEIATKAIASFLVAGRSISIVVALILFGTIVTIGAWFAGLGVAILLSATIPPNILLQTSAIAAVSLALASVGVLIVTISPQPANLVWGYFSIFLFLPWIDKRPDFKEFILAAVVFLICATASIFILERRCAT